MRFSKPEFNDNDNTEEPEGSEELENFLSQREAKDQVAEMLEAGLGFQELDQSMVYLAVKVAEKSLFWRFRSMSKKLAEINEAYAFLSKLVEEE